MNNEMDARKVNIPFCCALLTRSDILHGGYGGSKGSLRLCATFHTGAYNYMEHDVVKYNYIADKDGWKKYYSEN